MSAILLRLFFFASKLDIVFEIITELLCVRGEEELTECRTERPVVSMCYEYNEAFSWLTVAFWIELPAAVPVNCTRSLNILSGMMLAHKLGVQVRTCSILG